MQGAGGHKRRQVGVTLDAVTLSPLLVGTEHGINAQGAIIPRISRREVCRS